MNNTKKFMARMICCFIPVVKWRRNLRNFLLESRIKTCKLFEAQYDEKGFFQAYDTCVRYAFAREYLDGNVGFWYLMYIKMQTKRGTISDHDTGRFISLINSYVKYGYSGQKIVLYKQDKIVLADGSHRLALNLLFGYKWTYYERNEIDNVYRNYGIDWFRKNDFTDQEIAALIQVKREIFKRYNLKKQMD